MASEMNTTQGYFLNAEYLLNVQYRDASNLRARQELHARFSTNSKDINQWILEQLDLPADARILELGCGPGRMWGSILERIPDRWDITLTDFSPGMVENARRNLASANRPFDFRVMDAQEIEFEDNTFDGVIANYMLYHVPDKPKAFSEIERVLKPGAKLYAMTNGANHLREIAGLKEMLMLPDERKSELVPVLSFSLENGAEQLVPWFDEVEIRRFDDSLVVTEVEPLVAYILSSFRPGTRGSWRTSS